jgi:hypothetical protein
MQLITNPSADFMESTFREKLLEHVFVSELLQEVWLREGNTIEVLRAEVDSAGYDIVLEYNGIVRHVQLKSSRLDGRAAYQKVNIKLAEKPGGCVVWLMYDVDENTWRACLHYRFFGGPPGEKLDLEGCKVAKHTKADSHGIKAERPAIRVVPRSWFLEVADLHALIGLLFDVHGRTSLSNTPADAGFILDS